MTATREIPGFTGEVVTNGDPGYDEARAVWNAMHDRRPALVAYCTSPADVASAIAYARSHDLPIAVRSGGHSMPGHSVCDDGIVIDLRGMNRIEVDPQARRAVIGGGALLGEVDRATQAHGLVVPAGVVSHTGLGGLALGGGVGRLMRRFGLTVDSLLSAEVVTADGRTIRASPTEHPDLFWGLRGGGGNFGVVTEFEFALHDLSQLVILGTFHAIEDAPAVLAAADRTMSADPPDELLWTSFLRKAPPLSWMPPDVVGRPGVMSLIEWSGGIEAGRDTLGRICSELKPMVSSLETTPFLAMQTMTDEIFAPGQRTYLKAAFVPGLSPELIGVLSKNGARVSSPLSQIEVLSLGGAIARVPADAAAFPHRDARWLVNIPAMWQAPADTDAEVAWVRDAFASLEPHTTGATYVNFMSEDEQGRTTSAYGDTYARLRAVKREYDPDNVFCLNQNILPA